MTSGRVRRTVGALLHNGGGAPPPPGVRGDRTVDDGRRAPCPHPLPPAAARAAACADAELPALTRALLTELVEALPGAVSATVVTGAGPRLRSWAGVGPAGPDVDRLQARTGRGPAFTAAADPAGRPVVSRDLWTDGRWRLPRAHGTPLVHPVVAVALPGQERARAVLTVHGADDDLPAVSAGGALAAAELLRALSNATNTRLGQLADEVLFTGLVPEPPGPPPRG